jgi:hypothetical protein
MADDFFQQLTHIGSAFGPIGLMITGFLSRTVNKVTTDIAEAKKLGGEAMRLAENAVKSAAEAVKVAGEAKAFAEAKAHAGAQNAPIRPRVANPRPDPIEGRKIESGFEDLRRGLRLEVTAIKNAIDERFAQVSHEVRGLVRQLVEEAERRLDNNLERIVRGSRPEGIHENDALLAELKSTLEHEQEQRIAFQETTASYMKDGLDRWLKMERFLGSIETTVELWERERRMFEERIENLRRDVHNRPR